MKLERRLMLLQNQVLLPEMQQSQRMSDRFYNLLDYWNKSEKGKVSFEIDGDKHEIDYTLIPKSFLRYFDERENFGGYVADMIFISSEVVEKNPLWLPYIALKLYSERSVDVGLDSSGKVKHWKSLLATMNLAGKTMPREESEKFLRAIEENESSKGFNMLRESYDKFIINSGKDPLEERRKYLERHHENLWVRKGREAEALDDFGYENDGYRNHAEAVIRSIPNLDVENQYLLAEFLNVLISSKEDSTIEISHPYSSFAYSMTSEGNGLVDLVRFQESESPSLSDIIYKVSKKDRTLTAISKRISYKLHKAEEHSRRLIQEEKKKLEGIIITLGNANQEMKGEIEKSREMIVNNPFGNIREKLKLLGMDYLGKIKSLERESEEILSNLRGLEDLSKILESRI